MDKLTLWESFISLHPVSQFFTVDANVSIKQAAAFDFFNPVVHFAVPMLWIHSTVFWEGRKHEIHSVIVIPIVRNIKQLLFHFPCNFHFENWRLNGSLNQMESLSFAATNLKMENSRLNECCCCCFVSRCTLLSVIGIWRHHFGVILGAFWMTLRQMRGKEEITNSRYVFLCFEDLQTTVCWERT